MTQAREPTGLSLVSDLDLSPSGARSLLDLAVELKTSKQCGENTRHLVSKTIALLFQHESTRTRCAFEVAAYAQGAHATYINAASSHLGHKESVKDTARVLGRLYDGIAFRGSDQQDAAELATHASVPVWNALTNDWHPTQSLADALTMGEHSGKPYADISFAYVGDARNNTASSLTVMGSLLGMDVRLVAPRELWPDQNRVLNPAHRTAEKTGAQITVTDDIATGTKNVDFIYTDVWVSMSEAPKTWSERIRLLAPYQINEDVVKATGNPNVKFMHCLPALHNTDTELGTKIYEETGMRDLEVTNDIFESDFSIVFDQAENRVHTIEALMVASLR